MHARSAKRGIAIVSRPSVCLSVCDVDVPWAYVSGYFETNYTISLGSSLLRATTPAIYYGNTLKNSGAIGVAGSLFSSENLHYLCP